MAVEGTLTPWGNPRRPFPYGYPLKNLAKLQCRDKRQYKGATMGTCNGRAFLVGFLTLVFRALVSAGAQQRMQSVWSGQLAAVEHGVWQKSEISLI